MANQERPGGTGRPEIDNPGTPHPGREDREIQNPSPRTTPTENPKVRANQKGGQGKPSGNPPTTPIPGGDDDESDTTRQRPGRDRHSNPASDPERRTETERKGNR